MSSGPFLLQMAYDNEHLIKLKDLQTLIDTFKLNEMYKVFNALKLYIDDDGDLAQKDS